MYFKSNIISAVSSARWATAMHSNHPIGWSMPTTSTPTASQHQQGPCPLPGGDSCDFECLPPPPVTTQKHGFSLPTQTAPRLDSNGVDRVLASLVGIINIQF